jgi:osmotically-inducible protein OsmY
MDAAKRVADIKAVIDNIDVRLECEMRTTDEGLAKESQWNVSIAGKEVKAEVKNGVVTLTGGVDWQYQRINIERNFEHVRGVANIVNLITVKQHVSTIDVRQKIKEALQRHAEVEASKITVAASDGTETTLPPSANHVTRRS